MSSIGYPVPTATMPSFHDGHLTSILVDEQSAILGLVNSSGNALELRLEDVESLQAENFRQGNIILSLEVIRAGEIVNIDLDERLERLFPSPHPSAAQSYHERQTEFIRGVLARIASGDALMVIVQATYGCDLVAVCCDIRLTQLSR